MLKHDASSKAVEEVTKKVDKVDLSKIGEGIIKVLIKIFTGQGNVNSQILKIP